MMWISYGLLILSSLILANSIWQSSEITTSGIFAVGFNLVCWVVVIRLDLPRRRL